MKNFSKAIKNPISLLIVVIVIYIVVFNQVVSLWLSYATLDLYNYLLITPIVILFVYTNSLREISFDYFSKKYLFYIIMYLAGSFLVLYSTTSELYADQLIIFGFIMLLHSLLVLITSRNNLYRVLLLTPLLLIFVPVPQQVVYNLSAILTRYLLDSTIPISRFLKIPLSVVETSGFILVNIVHNNEVVRFNIAPVCSGIIGLFSVIAVSPIVIIASFNGERSISRKIIASVVGVILFIVLMFLSNVIRLVMVFYFTSLYGLEVGYHIFHYTPEILLTLPVVFIVIKIIDAISGNISLFPKRSWIVFNKNTKPYVLLIAIFFLIPLSLPIMTITYRNPNSLFIHTINGPIMLFNTTSGLKELFIPTYYRGVSIEYVGRDYEVEKTLGPMHRVHLYRGVIDRGKYIDVYVEFSTHPTIHIWELCLWWQNITVYSNERFFVTDPSNLTIYSAKILYYRGGYLNGVLSTWRNKYYTEKGIELSRFTIMINSLHRDLNDKDIEVLKNLTSILIIKSGEASIAKYSKIAGFDTSYYFNVLIPFTTASTLVMLIRERVPVFIYLKRLIKQ